MENKNILIIAGEPSGDIRGAELLSDLVPLLPDVSFWGIGGDLMQKKGLQLIEHIRDLSVVGIVEVIKKLPKIRSQYKNCVNSVALKKPSAVILIDYPGFNLRIAKYLKKAGIPVIYYIIPQVWAWGQNRTERLKQHTDLILVLFEFEKQFLLKYGIESTFAGHPIIDSIPDIPETKKTDDSFTIALLPGSRHNEITRLLPPMLKAAAIIKEKSSRKIRIMIAESSNVAGQEYNNCLQNYSALNVRRVKDDTFSVLTRSDFAIVTSGTATLETSIAGVPFVITYKMSPISAFISKLFIKVPFIGLANIVAGKEVAPEFMQENATGEKISKKVLEMISSDTLLETTRQELKKIKESLGEKGSSKRAAKAIKQFLCGG